MQSIEIPNKNPNQGGTDSPVSGDLSKRTKDKNFLESKTDRTSCLAHEPREVASML